MSSPRSSTPPASTRRLLNELRDYAKDPNPCLVRLGPVSDNDLLHWEAVMKGVDSGGYESMLFFYIHNSWRSSLSYVEF
jgi:peroxin-4